ncbi:hypothetical protein ISN45_Aa01g033000 [Arabidopsis thaliana x Arabidopsis arenosa]|uniref:Uncharacterized protein n=1 Tax=Arabidopsis thaliana x Arabidopsis arenosa TaxID=1240361 RepID=A0A8T2C656_9BRAS|nr:hypothetical protein ISN45_Aa01g033000 [Arabidopsis thaliana x Arabidopsis arenosa]
MTDKKISDPMEILEGLAVRLHKIEGKVNQMEEKMDLLISLIRSNNEVKIGSVKVEAESMFEDESSFDDEPYSRFGPFVGGRGVGPFVGGRGGDPFVGDRGGDPFVFGRGGDPFVFGRGGGPFVGGRGSRGLFVGGRYAGGRCGGQGFCGAC